MDSATANRPGIHRVSRAFSVLAVLLAFISLTSGCLLLLGAGAAATGIAYYEGKLKGTMQADPPAVAAATGLAFQSLQIARVSSAATGLDAEIVGRTADDTRVAVSVERKAEGISEVSIRVGTFGNKSLSLTVYNEILKHLKGAKDAKSPKEPTPI